ncbi:hypothetical protein [Paenibacillus sp. PL2-23]|uniref:hypothetical protein n=1 Tax=Paenibacillus sp. PL2-23 TaxID=2100729 RepID=UPI0030FB1F2F
MSKPEWYERAGKEPFKRNHFNANLAALTKKRLGSVKHTQSRSKWYIGAIASVLGVIIIISNSIPNEGSVDLPVQSQSPAATPFFNMSSAQIRMVDKINGWAFGTSVKRTNDGGQTWVDRTPQGYDNSRYEPFLFDEQFAYFVVRPADIEMNWIIYSTNDGGDSWISSTLPTKDTWSAQSINTSFSLFFIDEKTGFVSFISDPASGPVITALYQTKDGGLTWEYADKITPDGTLVSTQSGMSFSNSMVGFITLFNSRDLDPEIYRTIDGGASWKRLTLDLPQDNKDAVYSASQPPQFFGNAKQEGVLSVSYMTSNNEKAGIVWFTTENGGVTWRRVIPREGEPTVIAKNGSSPIGFHPITASDHKHFWMIDAEKGTLYGTSDGGVHWKVLITLPELRNATELKFVDHKIGWVRGDGYLLRTEDGGISWATTP